MQRDDENTPNRRRFLQRIAVVAGTSAFVGTGNFLERFSVASGMAYPDPPDGCPAMPAGGAPFVPGSDTRPIVLRKSINALSSTELTTLRDAYKALRALPLTDKRTWVLQADLHALYCYSCNNSTVDIHGSWTFFPWHRGYLYYYERILGSLVGDPENFRLPYWDWENVRAIPAAYTTPSGVTNNSLYDAVRDGGMANGDPLPINDGSSTQIANLNGLTDFADFGGSAFGSGAMEPSPHGAIHVDVGQHFGQQHDMGDLAYAARDPLFFAHHCNIDKLWSRWNDKAGGAGLPAGAYRNPTDPGFLNARWSFYDENQQTVSISAADVLNHRNNLRYIYGLVRIPFPPRWYFFKCRLFCCRPGPDPAPFIQMDERDRESILRALSRSQSSVMLLLRGVRFPAKIAGAFDVLAVSGDKRVPVGSIGIVGHSGVEHREGPRPTTLALDITTAAQDLLKKDNPATLHVVRRSESKAQRSAFVLQADSAEIRVQQQQL